MTDLCVCEASSSSSHIVSETTNIAAIAAVVIVNNRKWNHSEVGTEDILNGDVAPFIFLPRFSLFSLLLSTPSFLIPSSTLHYLRLFAPRYVFPFPLSPFLFLFLHLFLPRVHHAIPAPFSPSLWFLVFPCSSAVPCFLHFLQTLPHLTQLSDSFHNVPVLAWMFNMEAISVILIGFK